MICVLELKMSWCSRVDLCLGLKMMALSWLVLMKDGDVG